MSHDSVRLAPASAGSVLAPKRPILVSSFNYRAFANWEPIFWRLRDRGHAVHTAWFPRVSDPDHVGLFDIDFPNALTCRIGGGFRSFDPSADAGLSDFADLGVASRPEVVFPS